MADQEKSKSYPSWPSKNWWDLRARFKQAVPGRVDPDYLQAVLGVGDGHARNLIPQLKSVGLIDDAGTPTDLAHDWRDDQTYPAACAQMRDEIYPQGLRDALPPPNPDRGAVEQWFMRNAKVGEGAAGKMATFYLLVCAADPTSQGNGAKREAKPTATSARRAATSKSTTPAPAVQQVTQETAKAAQAASDGGPSLHVDVQVHISPDATADQIDLIFSAMAKHLYKR